ncbi:MAG: DUF2780 domain-containing protein [Dehalococcoidia bacterium]|nr:DUF2780 domain-containing protein [Dehalococcoidia bacterium]
MELVDLLVKNLGVDKDQAEGGAGTIFKMAREQMGSDDFSKLTNAIPEIGKLAKSVPGAEGAGGGVGGLMDAFGGLTGGGGKTSAGVGGLMDMVGKLASATGGDSQLGQLGKLAQLAGAFEKLGIDPGMVAKFLPIILSFVQKKGGSDLVDLLQGALGTDAR